ncbi:hypothetical protein [Microbacterium sp.]|uniref:hypothetical protein n=1 Tax=Microbacterium sp. TaxID=51671 RepID=UPI003A9010AA
MSEQQYLWAPTPDKPKRGRVWLLVALVVVALLIVGGVLWLFLRPGTPDAAPAATTTPTLSASPSPSPTPTTTPTPTVTPPAPPTPSAAPSQPVQTAPPVVKDPSIAVFRDKVAPVLSDAHRGLQIAAQSDPQQAAQNVGFLQDDAGRLSDAVPPASIAQQWSAALQNYSAALQSLRAAYDAGKAGTAELAAATKALNSLDGIVG